MKNKFCNFAKLKSRPPEKQRLFRSEITEKIIVDVSTKIHDTDVRRMFELCLPNTFVATGDIPAMWLRDSTNQVWPYLRYINRDEKLKKLFVGLIYRQWKKGVWERKYELDSLCAFFRLSVGYMDILVKMLVCEKMGIRPLFSNFAYCNTFSG